MKILIFVLMLGLGACATPNEAPFWGGIAKELHK